jgi:hypothetical protein
VSSADVSQFQQIGQLLEALGDRRQELLRKVSCAEIADKISKCNGKDLAGVTIFMAHLDDERRSDLIQAADWAALSIKCPLEARMLHALGSCLENACKKNKNGCEQLGQQLRTRRDQLVRVVEDAYERADAAPALYAGVAKFLRNCNRIDKELAIRIAESTMNKALEYFCIRPTAYRAVSELINSFYILHPAMARGFVEKPRVHGRITSCLNSRDCANEPSNVRLLVKAIYQACPSVWFIMLMSLTTNLRGIDLDSLYREVLEPAALEQALEIE